MARRYLTDEPGAARVRQLFRPSAGHRLFVARATHAELASSLIRAERVGRIDRKKRVELWRLFRSHAASAYQIVELTAPVVNSAADLLFRSPLRAYDAVQVASALSVGSQPDAAGNFRFVTADRDQATAARAEGLDVDFVP